MLPDISCMLPYIILIHTFGQGERQKVGWLSHQATMPARPRFCRHSDSRTLAEIAEDVGDHEGAGVVDRASENVAVGSSAAVEIGEA